MNTKKPTPKPKTPKPAQPKPELCGAKALRKGLIVTCWCDLGHDGKHIDKVIGISWRPGSYES